MSDASKILGAVSGGVKGVAADIDSADKRRKEGVSVAMQIAADWYERRRATILEALKPLNIKGTPPGTNARKIVDEAVIKKDLDFKKLRRIADEARAAKSSRVGRRKHALAAVRRLKTSDSLRLLFEAYLEVRRYMGAITALQVRKFFNKIDIVGGTIIAIAWPGPGTVLGGIIAGVGTLVESLAQTEGEKKLDELEARADAAVGKAGLKTFVEEQRKGDKGKGKGKGQGKGRKRPGGSAQYKVVKKSGANISGPVLGGASAFLLTGNPLYGLGTAVILSAAQKNRSK